MQFLASVAFNAELSQRARAAQPAVALNRVPCHDEFARSVAASGEVSVTVVPDLVVLDRLYWPRAFPIRIRLTADRMADPSQPCSYSPEPNKPLQVTR